MDDFLEVKAGVMSLTRNKLVNGVGINDSWYFTERVINSKRVSCPYYARWSGMLNRCYSKAYQLNQPTYVGCTVCDEWLTFSNFKAWMENQEWKGKYLDKDILVQGNKVYSPLTCLFVTRNINNLLNDSSRTRGLTFQGVSFKVKRNKYQASVCINGKKKFLGYFTDENVAFDAYKKAKYEIINDIAKKQTEPLRSALLAYKIK